MVFKQGYGDRSIQDKLHGYIFLSVGILNMFEDKYRDKSMKNNYLSDNKEEKFWLTLSKNVRDTQTELLTTEPINVNNIKYFYLEYKNWSLKDSLIFFP